jgi:YD repeat-containing protein
MPLDIPQQQPGERLIDGTVINQLAEAIGDGGVTSVSVVTANGISGTVANPTVMPAITLQLNNITPLSVAASGTIIGSNLSGTNTGDQTIILTGDVTGAGTGSFATTLASVATPGTNTKLTYDAKGRVVSGTTLSASDYPVFVGDSGSGGVRGAVPAPATGDAVRFLQGDGTWGSPAGSGTVTNVSGTSNRISVTNGTSTPVIDIDAAYVGQSSITTLGTIVSGTWQGGVVGATYGGTGVNNGTSIITLGGSLTTSGAHPITFTTTGTTSVTLPTSGTLVNSAVTSLASLATVGTIGTGVWQGSVIGAAYGGTGVNNSSTITLSGNFSTSGVNTLNLATTGNTNVTLPTSGTLVNTTSSAIAFTGGTIDGATLGATTPMQIQGFRPVNTQTGTTYTLVLGDSGKLVTLNNASAITLTIPPHSSVAFPAQAEIDIAQLGAGQVTVSPGVGVTILSVSSNTHLSARYAGATLKQTATQDTWLLIGSLS